MKRLSEPMALPFQHGLSLLVVLVLLLGMALLGAAVLQSGLLHTRMASGLHAQHLAFTAAESALRAGETLAATSPAPPASGCVNGLCTTPEATVIERWKQPGFNHWQSMTSSSDSGMPGGEFIVEWMGTAPITPGCEHEQPLDVACLRPLYRITARSTGHGTVRVRLQSHYLDARVSWREVMGE